MSKIIIHVEDGIDEQKALGLVKDVVSMGRISNKGKQYCYATVCDTTDGKIVIWTKLNKSSDVFILQKEKE